MTGKNEIWICGMVRGDTNQGEDSVKIVIDSSNFDDLPSVWTVNDLDNNLRSRKFQ